MVGRKRLAIAFEPGEWTAIRARLAAQVGAENIAGHLERAARPLVAQTAKVHAFPRFGMAFVEPGVGVAAGQLRKLFPQARVRDEYALQRTQVRYEETATRAVWSDDASICWPLKALGLRPDDHDGAGILVGVIDSGVAVDHPALVHCIDATRSLVEGHPGSADDLGHGTHVAGLVAGGRDQQPRYGVAPAARIRSYRIYGDRDATDEVTMLRGVEAAIGDGCKVLVLATGRPSAETYDQYDALLGQHVLEQGCLLFAAAGNESDRPVMIAPVDAPANAPNIFGIGSVTPTDDVWHRSNGHDLDAARRVDWIAPGQYVTSALAGGTTIAVSGTSAATAIAAGAAAALWSRDATLTADGLVTELVQRAVRQPADDVTAVGNGRLQLGAAERSPVPPLITPRNIMPTVLPTTDDASIDSIVARATAANPSARMRITVIDVIPEPGAPVNGAMPSVLPSVGLDAAGYSELQTKWNMSGHSVIAELAGVILQRDDPTVYQAVLAVMEAARLPADDDTGLGGLAAWPDRIKAPPRGTPKEIAQLGQEHKPDHYINIPYTPGKAKGKPADVTGQSLLNALPTWMDQLTHGSDATARLEALAFVLHLVGDAHQPLHCAVLIDSRFHFALPEGDQGGNLVWFNKTSELHALWDNIIATSTGSIPKAVAKLQQGLDRTSFPQLSKPKLADWLAETYELGTQAYDEFLKDSNYKGPASRVDRFGHTVQGQQFEPPSDEYRTWARGIAEKQARVAAFRLADTLKACVGGGTNGKNGKTSKTSKNGKRPKR
jgi:hypothetical protein